MAEIDKIAIIWSIAIVAGALSIVYSQETGLNVNNSPSPYAEEIFFTLQGEDSVGMFDKRISAGPKMTYITTSLEKDIVLATSSASDTIFAYDKKGNKLASITVGSIPKGVKINKDLAFVANEKDGTIGVIDIKKLKVVKEIPIGDIPHNIVFSPKGESAYVTLQGEDRIAVIDVRTLEKTDSFPVGKMPHNLDITRDGKYLLTTNIGTDDVAVIDLRTYEIIKRIPVSKGHHGIDVDPSSKRAYVSGIGSDLVNVIDLDSLELIKTIYVGQGPHGIRTSLDGSKVYVAVTKLNEIVVIDSQDLEVKQKIPVGGGPFWIAIPGNQ